MLIGLETPTKNYEHSQSKKKQCSPFKRPFINTDYDRISNGSLYLNKIDCFSVKSIIIIIFQIHPQDPKVLDRSLIMTKILIISIFLRTKRALIIISICQV